MPRKKRADEPRKRHISIPESLDTEVNRLLANPITGKPKPGAFSKLIVRLLRHWVRRKKEERGELSVEDERSGRLQQEDEERGG